MPIRVSVTSRPFFSKMPSSRATAAEAQSVVAVQPMLSAVCAVDAPVHDRAIMVAPSAAFVKPFMKLPPKIRLPIRPGFEYR